MMMMPNLCYRERKRLWMSCEILPSSGEWRNHFEPPRHIILSYGLDVTHTGTNWRSTFIQPHQLNGLFSSQGRNWTETLLLYEVAQNFLSENNLKEKKKKKGSTLFVEPVTCCTVCFCQAIASTHKKDKYTFQPSWPSPPTRRLPPPPFRYTTSQQNRRNNWKTDWPLLAHSVCRVYMTMLKWGDLIKKKKNLLLAVTLHLV